jgi:hypothetical protein
MRLSKPRAGTCPARNLALEPGLSNLTREPDAAER